MKSSVLQWLMPLAILAILPANLSGEENESVGRVIDGAVARCSAIQSGTFHYRYGSLWADPAKPKPWAWDAKDGRSVFLTIAGEQWVVRWPKAANAVMHRKAYDATYVPTKQRDGTTHHGFRLTKPETTLEAEAIHDQKFQIARAGTIPWPVMQGYLDRNRQFFMDRGTVALEGEKTRLLEMIVPRRDYFMLNSYNPVLSEKDNSTLLRIYIIPKMGYVVRRIDYCTPDGTMANRYESNNFKEVDKGVYFPTNYYYIRNFHDFGNRKGYYTDQFQIIELTGVNKPVPESAFEVALPAGTDISDYRTDDELHFSTKEAVQLSKIDEVIRKQVNATPGATTKGEGKK